MKDKLNQDIDKKISNCLNNKTEEISVSDDMFFKIRTEILKENKGAFYNMKLKRLKVKTAIVVGLLCIVTTATCLAVTKGYYWCYTTSGPIKMTSAFPSCDTVKSTAGFLPKYLEKFYGGFKFCSFSVYDSSLKINDDSPIIKGKEAVFWYNKDEAKKNQNLHMDTMSIEKKYIDEGKEKLECFEYDGIKIYYRSFQQKEVPEDYVKTEEDIKLINEGLLNIRFCSNEINEYRAQYVNWYDNGIEYTIMNCAYDDIDKNAMIEMAKTVINK